jgi:fucose permease
MTVPGSTLLAVIGMMALGLAAAPIFPLLTLTTAERTGTAEANKTTRAVASQVAASTIGSAALPAGIGVVIGATNATALAPFLLALGIGMCGVYAVMTHLARQHLAH